MSQISPTSSPRYSDDAIDRYDDAPPRDPDEMLEASAPTTHDLTALLPRLERIRQYVNRAVNLEMELWLGFGGDRSTTPVIRWTVWDGASHHHGDTPDMALRVAELVLFSTHAPVTAPTVVVTPFASGWEEIGQ